MPDEIKTATSSADEQAKKIVEETKEFLAEAMRRFKLAQEAESELRHESLEDLKFSVGEQWSPDIQTDRETDRRPCLTINRLPPIINQVINDERQNRPGITISPVGSKGDIDTAQILQGMVRHIEVDSDADVSYDTAFDFSVRIGFGFWRVVTEYESDSSFNQIIKIVRIKNPFCVYFDPNCQEVDYSDARWCFIVEDVDRDEYKERYPNSVLSEASLTDFQGVGNTPPDWLTKETIRVCEYFYVVEKKKQLLKLSDGTILLGEEYEKLEGEEKPEITGSRDVLTRRVMWSKINAVEVLEENEVPCQWITVVPVLGNDLDIDGKRHLSGLVRGAKDSQRMYNYWKSAATEIIALAPKSPYIGAEGQFEGHEEQWQQANIRNFPFLTYKPTSLAGQPLPAPQRNIFEPPVQAISLMVKGSDEDIKATTGIYDAALGARGPEQSGKAILARQRQSSISVLNYGANLSRAIRFTGRIIVDMIPKIYDVPRVAKIINPDQSVTSAAVFNSKITGMTPDEAKSSLEDDKIEKIYDVGVGRYNVAISSGPSYNTKREEAVAAISSLVQSYPNLMAIAGDLLVRQMDWPYAQEIANRLQTMLPPELKQIESDDPKMQAQQLQVQLQTLMKQQDALVQELNAATETIKTKRIETESKERIAVMETQAQLILGEAKIQGEAALTSLKAMIGDIQNRLKLLHEGEPIESETSTQ